MKQRCGLSRVVITPVIGALLALLAACGGGEDPTPTATSSAPTATSPAPTATSPAVRGETPLPPTPTATAVPTPTWEVEWDQLVEAANEEGVVVVGISRSAYRRGAESFQEVFPDIAVEGLTGSGAALSQRVLLEYDAGVHSADLLLGNSSSAMSVLLTHMQKTGEPVLGDIRAALFRPDVVGDENWVGSFDDGFIDKPTNKYGFTWTAQRSTGVTIYVNREVAPPEVYSTIDDLLRPEFHGKWCLLDPVSLGAGEAFVLNILLTKGEEYVRRLLTETEPLVGTQSRELARDLIDGRMWACNGAYMEDFWAEGVGLHVELDRSSLGSVLPAYIERGVLSNCCGEGSGKAVFEGGWSTQTGGPTLIGGAPNPNAAKLFVNYMSTTDGQVGWLEPHAGRLCSRRVELHKKELCPQSDLIEEGRSYFATDRTNVAWIEEEAHALVVDIYGGR